MTKYTNGKIYKIQDLNGDMCYIGSTTRPMLSERMSGHRSAYKRWKAEKPTTRITVFEIFDTYGVENCRIILLELYPCNTKDELLSREAHFIRAEQCVNKVIPDRTQKEYKDTHKMESHIQKQKYYIKNKEKIAIHKKQYLSDNLEAINERRKAVIECICGGHYVRSNKSLHYVSKKHLTNLKE